MSEQISAIPEIEIPASKLPSRGVPYPKDAIVKYRTYTWGEVRRSSNGKINVIDTLKQALSGINCSFDKNQLTVADAFYLSIARKISTFSGMKIEVPYICTACGHKNNGVFTEKDISFRDLPERVTEFPLIATLNGVECEFAPLTIKQFFDLHQGVYKAVIPNNEIDEVAIQAGWIKNLPYAQAYKLVASLTNPDDFDLITEIDDLMLHDMERIEFTCEEKTCKHKNLIRLEGREALLQPFRDGVNLNKDRIRIGKRHESTDNAAGQPGV